MTNPYAWADSGMDSSAFDEDHPANKVRAVLLEPVPLYGPALSAVVALADIIDVLWPPDDPEHDWSPDTVEAIAAIVLAAGLYVHEREPSYGETPAREAGVDDSPGYRSSMVDAGRGGQLR